MPENEFEFRAVYDGEGLREGSMDARDLAPALLGFADLVDNGARLVVPEAPAVTVRVRSDFQRGSFDIALQIAGAYNQFVSLFSGAQAQAWSTLLSLLGISGVGVFQLIKRAKGRKPTVISIERSEKVTLSVEGDDQIEIPKAVWNLFNNSGVRRSIERITEPLKREGIEHFELKSNNQTFLAVDKDEAANFDAPREDSETSVSENPNAILIVIAPSFSEGNKWRVSDGNRSIWVTIEDKEFLAAVNSGREAFRKGDILHVSLETHQCFEDKELKTEYIIRKVHRHESRLQTSELSEAGDTA